MSSGGGSSGQAPNTYYAIGVPHPSAYFGYNPLTVTHTVPAEWPSGESVGNYYIDSSHGSATDTSNPYGYPAQPRLTAPDGVTLGAGKVYAFGGGGPYGFSGNSLNILFEGTQEAPCFLIFDYGGTRVRISEFVLPTAGSTHAVIEGGETYNLDSAIDFSTGDLSYLTVRDWLNYGDNSSLGNGSIYSIDTITGNHSSYLVFYNNEIRNIGSLDPGLEDDLLGITAGEDCSWVWVLDNLSFNLGGDSMRTGSNYNSIASDATEPHHLFIAKNDFGDNGENPIDIKRSHHIVISENLLHTATVSLGDPGAMIPMHEKCDTMWVIANKIYDANRGINMSTALSGASGLPTADNLRCILNVFYDITSLAHGGEVEDDLDGDGKLLNLGGANSVGVNWVAFNTFYGNDGAVRQVGSNQNTHIVSNIFANRLQASQSNIVYANTSGDDGVEIDYNVHESFAVYVNGSRITNIASMPGTFEDHGVSGGSADFTNAAAGDFTLGASSNALAVGTSSSAAALLALFETEMGFPMTESGEWVDAAGTTRPESIEDWDAGAYQRAA